MDPRVKGKKKKVQGFFGRCVMREPHHRAQEVGGGGGGGGGPGVWDIGGKKTNPQPLQQRPSWEGSIKSDSIANAKT